MLASPAVGLDLLPGSHTLRRRIVTRPASAETTTQRLTQSCSPLGVDERSWRQHLYDGRGMDAMFMPSGKPCFGAGWAPGSWCGFVKIFGIETPPSRWIWT